MKINFQTSSNKFNYLNCDQLKKDANIPLCKVEHKITHTQEVWNN
jgi:hypothetical protein